MMTVSWRQINCLRNCLVSPQIAAVLPKTLFPPTIPTTTGLIFVYTHDLILFQNYHAQSAEFTRRLVIIEPVPVQTEVIGKSEYLCLDNTKLSCQFKLETIILVLRICGDTGVWRPLVANPT